MASLPRDSGQLRIATTIVQTAAKTWRSRMEVPVDSSGSRAADIVLDSADQVLHIEIERSPVDLQAQIRAAQLKREMLAERDRRPVRLVVALPATSSNRQRLREVADLVARTLPVSSRRIWLAIRTGAELGGDGVLLVPRAKPGTTNNGATSLVDRIPAGLTSPGL
jgi:hypothetical protein